MHNLFVGFMGVKKNGGKAVSSIFKFLFGCSGFVVFSNFQGGF